MKVYVKVKASEELPIGIPFVHIIHEGGLIDSGFYAQNDKQWYDDESRQLHKVEYWLKEIELPDEDEIDKYAIHYDTTDDVYSEFVKNGISYILNKLK